MKIQVVEKHEGYSTYNIGDGEDAFKVDAPNLENAKQRYLEFISYKFDDAINHLLYFETLKERNKKEYKAASDYKTISDQPDNNSNLNINIVVSPKCSVEEFYKAINKELLKKGCFMW